MKLPQSFIRKLASSLSSEEIDLYILTLHYKNEADLAYFQEEDRKRIRTILDTLIHDTKEHSKLLELIVDMGS